MSRTPNKTESGPRRQGPGGRAQAARVQAAGPRRQGPGGRAQAAGPRRQGPRRQGPGGKGPAAGPRRQGPGPRRQGPGGRAQAARAQAAGPRRQGRSARAQTAGPRRQGPRRQGPRRQGPGGRAQAAVPLKQTRAQKTTERWAWEVRLSPVRQRLSPKALCRRKAEAAAQPRTAWRNPQQRKKGQKNSDDGCPQNSIFEIMPLGPPKEADTPPRGEGRGPSKFDFRNHDAWTPQRNRHPSTRRRGFPRNSIFEIMTLGPPKKQTPVEEGGGPQNSIFEIMTLGPPKGADTPPTGRVRGPQNSIFEIMTLGPPKEADTPPRGGGGALKIRFSKS